MISYVVVEAERKAMEAKQLFSRSSNLIKAEMTRFEGERIQDMKLSIETFLEGMASRQREASIPASRFSTYLSECNCRLYLLGKVTKNY